MVYTLRCQKCDQLVEVNHKMDEPHPETHSGCGGKLTRVFSTVGIIYRGGGFYTTDSCLTDKADPADF